MRKIGRAYRLGMVVYVAWTIVALVNGPLGLAMNLSLWVLWAILSYKPSTES